MALSLMVAVLGPAGGAAADADPVVTLSISRTEGTVGDPIDLTLKVRYDPALRIVPVPTGPSLGGLDVLRDSLVSEDQLADSSRIYERRWRLAAFALDTFWIPALAGELVDSSGQRHPWRSDSLQVVIHSVLPAEANPDSLDISGLKGPYEAPVPISAWWYALGGLLLTAMMAWLVWRKLRRRPSEADQPAAPPWEIAFSQLKALRTGVDPDDDGGRIWYFGLSEILRRYIDARYGWNTIDQTTTEIARRLPVAPFNGQHRERVQEFLRHADLIRYARTPAQRGRPEIDWEWMREFVEYTRPRAAAETTVSGASSEGQSDATTDQPRGGPA
jgi:hypothetical protein